MDKVFKYIDSQKKETVSFIRRLISIPSVNPPGDNYTQIASLIEAKCKESGLATKKIIIPETFIKKYGISNNKKRVCVIANWNVRSKKTIHINAHYDVVPCGTGWDVKPFGAILKNNRIYGRGAEDMKGNIGCYMGAVSALKACRIKPSCNLEFSFTPDEETGGETGFGYLVKNNLVKADYGIGEGYADNYLSYGNKGVVWLNVEVKGKSSHASKPYKGINSFEKMVTVADALMKLNKKISRRKTAYMTKEQKDKFSTMVIGGCLWGGVKINTVPDLSAFTIDRRFIPEENLHDVKFEIYNCIKKLKIKNAGPSARISVKIEQNCAVCEPNNELSHCFKKAVRRILKKNAKLAIMAGATDMRFLMEKGIPCIGYSAQGGGRCHADNEYVSIKSLFNTTKIFAYVFANLNDKE